MLICEILIYKNYKIEHLKDTEKRENMKIYSIFIIKIEC